MLRHIRKRYGCPQKDQAPVTAPMPAQPIHKSNASPDHEIAPVFLKNESRIEALFTVYFLALLTQALIERELRLAMKRETLDTLPLYPESRACRRPTTEHLFLRLFSLAQRHTLQDRGTTLKVLKTELTELQLKVLHLLGVPVTAYRRSR